MVNLYKITLLRFLLLLLLLPTGFRGQAQIGFNNPNPDPSSVIDIKATDRGLLIPRLTTVQRDLMVVGTIPPAHSLLVFDIDQKLFYYFDATANSTPGKWIALNTWLAEGAANANTILAKQGNVGIGTSSPSEKLEVVGNVKATGNITTEGTVTAANASISGTLTANNASFSGAMSSTSLSTTGTVTAAKFVGEGAVPVGTITMWSGSPAAIPAGWALCDGINGTPDLKGRFIVGYDPADTDYNTIGKAGGEKRHTLSVNEMPSHSHNFNFQEGRSDPTESGSEGQYVRAAGTNRTFLNAITNTGGNQPHENRPPFFTLAYIIKLPY